MMKKAGEVLQQARIKKNLSIEEVYEGTKIRPSYIDCIENSDYSAFHSQTTIKGFLKNYAQFLGINPETIVAVYRREQNTKATIQIKKRWKLKLPNISLSPSIFIVLASIFIVVGVIGFFTYQYVQVSQPPKFQILEPANNFTTTQDKIPVRVLREKDESIELQINNKSITSVDENGNFFTVIDLVDGKNQIVVQAINGFRKITRQEIVVVKIKNNIVQSQNLNIIFRSQSSKDINISYSIDDGTSTSLILKPGADIPLVGKSKLIITGPNNINNLMQLIINQTTVGLQNVPKQQIILNSDNTLKLSTLS